MIENSHNVFCKIIGRVQGVGYRAWAKKTAKQYFLRGWVKNCSDKSVELEISGEKENLEKFIKDCYDGPTFSKVKNVHFNLVPKKKYKDFEILY